MNEIIAKNKIHDGSLKDLEKKGVNYTVYNNWIKSLVFEEEDIEKTLEKIRNFHSIGFVEIVQREIVVRLIKLGWKAKTVKRKIKCGTQSTLITEFDCDHILFDGFCFVCLRIFLQNPEKFNKKLHKCENEWKYPVLIVNL
jgi:hypothetical protein